MTALRSPLMELRGRRQRRKAVLCFALVFLFSLCSLPTIASRRSISLDTRGLRTSSSFQDLAWSHRRRLSAGPGSYPPRCMYKCDRCTPCNPVHIPVPPGTLFLPTEYYPEAWRCKCGNKLYMP